MNRLTSLHLHWRTSYRTARAATSPARARAVDTARASLAAAAVTGRARANAPQGGWGNRATTVTASTTAPRAMRARTATMVRVLLAWRGTGRAPAAG